MHDLQRISPSLSSMLSRPWLVLVGGIVFVCIESPAGHAQMFGNRTVGSPLGSRSMNAPGGSSEQNAGILTGGERFIRGNRSRRDFVGSDRNEASGFVGAAQAIGVGRVPAATEGLKIETADAGRINRPLPKLPAKGMYYPRLELDAEALSTASATEVAAVATARLRARIERIAGGAVTLEMNDRVATLRGSVASAKEAEVLSNILRFEPGIDDVRNELNVAGP